LSVPNPFTKVKPGPVAEGREAVNWNHPNVDTMEALEAEVLEAQTNKVVEARIRARERGGSVDNLPVMMKG